MLVILSSLDYCYCWKNVEVSVLMNFDVLYYLRAVYLYKRDASYIDIYATELLARALSYTFLPAAWFYHDEARFLPLLDKDC